MAEMTSWAGCVGVAVVGGDEAVSWSWRRRLVRRALSSLVDSRRLGGGISKMFEDPMASRRPQRDASVYGERGWGEWKGISRQRIVKLERQWRWRSPP